MWTPKAGSDTEKDYRALDKDVLYDSEDEEHSVLDSVKSTVKGVPAAIGRVGLYSGFSKREVRKRPCAYCLGVLSCFIVVLVIAIMLTTLANLPILFLRLGEIEQGEVDIVIKAGGEASRATSLNYTRIDELFPERDYTYHSPRIVIEKDGTNIIQHSRCNGVEARNMWTLPAGSQVGDRCDKEAGCALLHCPTAPLLETELIFIDSEREARMGYGRAWTFPKINEGECLLDSAQARNLGVAVGDSITLAFSAAPAMLQAFNDAGAAGSFQPYAILPRVIATVRVQGIVSDIGGKIPNEAGDFVFLEYAYAARLVAANLHPDVAPAVSTSIASANPYDMANEVGFNFPPSSRMDYYVHTDYEEVQERTSAYASVIVSRIGFNQLDIDVPLVSFLFSSRFFSLFLGLILSLIILGLSFLSIVLIYSLLTVSIETKSFELGVLRMVGMQKVMLLNLVLNNAMWFALPAWVLGLILGQVVFLFIRSTLQSALNVDLNTRLSDDAIGYATLAGFGIPLFSAVFPMFGVLGQSLTDALNVNRSKINVVSYSINRTGSSSVDWLWIFLGTLMAVFGFLIYYLFPLGLLTFNIALLFYIFFGVLVGMLFGLVLLAVNFEQPLERFFTILFFFWESRTIRTLIPKNLVAHRVRNRKTTLMYSMALGFIIFISVAFELQISSVKFRTLRFMGGKLRAQGAMNFDQMSALQSVLVDNNVTFAWRTEDLDDHEGVDSISMATLGRFRTFQTRLEAVSPNFWDVAEDQFLIINNGDDHPYYSMSENLYSGHGSSRVVVGTTFKSLMALDNVESRFQMEVEGINNGATFTQRITTEALAFLDSSPVLSFSQFPQRVSQNSACSLPTLIAFSNGVLQSIQDVQYYTLVMPLEDEAERDRIDVLLSNEITRLGLNGDVRLRDYASAVKSADTAANIVNLFFIVTLIISMIICFFSLTSSMRTNVYEQTKEIGILRTLGFKKFPTKRLYIWESYILVFSASVLGIIVGIVVAYTMLLQQSLFTELPLPFVFPWASVIVVVVMSFISSLLASFGPISVLLRSSITQILRKTI